MSHHASGRSFRCHSYQRNYTFGRLPFQKSRLDLSEGCNNDWRRYAVVLGSHRHSHPSVTTVSSSNSSRFGPIAAYAAGGHRMVSNLATVSLSIHHPVVVVCGHSPCSRRVRERFSSAIDDLRGFACRSGVSTCTVATRNTVESIHWDHHLWSCDDSMTDS